jgi:hypothetical protein
MAEGSALGVAACRPVPGTLQWISPFPRLLGSVPGTCSAPAVNYTLTMRKIAANARLRYTALRYGPSPSRDRVMPARWLYIVSNLINRNLTVWPTIHKPNVSLSG